ncbi:MAG: zeta toxin family protein [Candidatus Coprovivens sp.]
MNNNSMVVNESLRTGLIEYINSVINLYFNYMSSRSVNVENDALSENYKRLCELPRQILHVDKIEELYKYKQSVGLLEDEIEKGIREERINKLSSRERALVDRGYDVDDVIRLSYYSEEQAKDAAEIIYNRITNGCTSVDNPVCIYLGGQPGCGKSTVSMTIKENFNLGGIVEIGIDNYRTYHPNYLEIERAIKKHWEGKTPTENDSPGNDIADFTHSFAGRMTDILQVLISDKRFNIVMEWGMRTPEGPLATMKSLKEKGYKNIVNFIAVHKDVSLEACKIRADVMNDYRHIVRRVPNYFHELACSTLADSAKTIYEEGFIKSKTVDNFFLVNRNSKVLWKHGDQVDLASLYNDWLNNPINSVEFTNNPEFAKMAYLNEAYGFNDKRHNELTGSGLKM